MARARNVGIDSQKAIINGHKDGMSYAQLGRQFSLSKTAVHAIVSRFKTRGGVVKA